MTRVRFAGLLVAAVSVASLLPATSAQADPIDYVHNAPMMPQDESDAPPEPSVNPGWPQATASGGVEGRPVVTGFRVDDVSKLSASATPGSNNWSDGWRVVISPSNVCRVGQSPSSGECYLAPNRIGVTVAYQTDSGLFYNFDGSLLTSLGVTTSTEFDLTIDLQNYFGTRLGWTWMNGQPTYWNVTGNVVHIKGKPAFMPSSRDIDSGCTRVPVEGCSTKQAKAELLTFNMVISVDTTGVPEVFAKTLFASEGAIIGSLDVAGGYDPAKPSSNVLSYSVAAPHEFAPDYPTVETGGANRTGTFYAVLPDSVLTTAFGVADPATDDLATLLAVTRSRDRATATDADVVTWTAKTAEEFGTLSHLLKIENISFSAPRFRLKRTAAVAQGKYVSASRVRDNVGVPTPTWRQRVKVYIAADSKSICRYSSSTGKIKGLAVGTCNYVVKLIKRSNGAVVLRKTGLIRVTAP